MGVVQSQENASADRVPSAFKVQVQSRLTAYLILEGLADPFLSDGTPKSAGSPVPKRYPPMMIR